MAEFTRDIKQLQQTANQQPSFAPPARSVGEDIVNLVGTGLDFYAKTKAQGELKRIGEMKEKEATLVDQSILDYRNFRLEMGLNGKSSGAAFLAADANFLKNIPKHLRSSVISGTNKLTGQTATDVMTANEKAMVTAQEARKTEVQEALRLGTLAGMALDPAAVDSMSEDDLRSIQLAGVKVEAERTARLAQLSEDHKKAQTVTAKRSVESNGWLEMTNKDYVANMSVRANTMIRNMGGASEQNTSSIIESLQELKAGIANEVQSEFVRPARAKEIFVSQDVIDTAVSSAEAGIDAYMTMLQNQEGIQAVRTLTSLNVEGGLLKLMASSDPATARAAQMLSISKFIGLPTEIGEFDGFAKFIGGTLAGEVSLADPKVRGRLVGGVSALSPLDPKKARDNYLEVDSILEAYLDGTPSAQKAVVSSGAFGKVVSTMAEEGSIIVDPASRELQADRMYKLSSKALAATVQDINIQQAFKGAQNKLFTTNPNTYDLNTDNGQFKLVAPFANAQPNAAVKQFNKLMADQMKAFEELGMDKEYIDRFKNDISISLSVFPTERQ